MKKNKGENNIINNIIKLIILLIGIIIQIVVFLFLYSATNKLSDYGRIIFTVIQFLSVIYIIYKDQNAAYKIVWIILLMFLPIAGFVAYLLWGNNKSPKYIKEEINKNHNKTKKILPQHEEIIDDIKNLDRKKEVKFLLNGTSYPIYNNKKIEYLKIGEEYYKRLKEDLKQAKEYILIEYFIISDGKMWDEIYEILKEKRKQNVKIYIIFDALGSLFKKPKDLKKQLEEANIEYLAFNPLTTFIRSYINYRDHRKIVVIDGKVGYTGGINIGDEYINLTHRLGHWKDCGVRIEGEGIKSLISIFFTLWNMNKENVNYESYINEIEQTSKEQGYIIPFSDNPHNKINPMQNTYINIINNAQKYVYIMTPYLILDSETEQALINTSLSGINIKIITPSIPDKKLVNACTKSFYGKLLEAGIEIYEYKPGFIHSKVILSDDEVSIVGTANFDFRSFYLNYECGIWMYSTLEELNIKKDFEETLKQCEKIELKVWKKRKLDIRIIEALLRLISPLL